MTTVEELARLAKWAERFVEEQPEALRTPAGQQLLFAIWEAGYEPELGETDCDAVSDLFQAQDYKARDWRAPHVTG